MVGRDEENHPTGARRTMRVLKITRIGCRHQQLAPLFGLYFILHTVRAATDEVVETGV